MALLKVNQILQKGDKLERIIWIDESKDLCFLINCDGRSFPYQASIKEMEAQIELEEVEVVEEKSHTSLKEDSLTDSERKKRDIASTIVQKLLVFPDILLADRRAIMIKEASLNHNVSLNTVRNYLKKYWARGMTKNALVPNYFKCGTKKDGDRVYVKKAGRAQIYQSSIERSFVTEKWKSIFRKSLEKHYFLRSKPSLKHAYQQMLKDHFSYVPKGSEYALLDKEQPIPTFDQFYYWVRKLYRSDYIVKKREGKKEFLQNHRSIVGSATEDANGIGLFAIDATVGDIFLISSIGQGRKDVIGRPLIYLVVDIFSRMIMGFHVGIEGMSNETIRMALISTFQKKSEYCQTALGMDLEDSDWDSKYLPHSLLADRGSEIISNELSSVVENLNITLKNTPTARPELKGICEAYFHILQNTLSPYLPGVVRKDFNERGAQDYRKHAVLTLSEYGQIVVRCIIFYNNHHYLKGYPLSKEMIDMGVVPIASNIFQFGLQQGSGQLRTISTEVLRTNLLPSQKATVTGNGIRFMGLYYTCFTALKEGWFSEARTNRSWKLEIQYDPCNMSEIYLRKDRHSMEVCKLLDQYMLYRSAKVEEVVSLKKSQKQNETNYEETEINEKMKLSSDIESMIKKAKQEGKNQTKMIILENISTTK